MKLDKEAIKVLTLGFIAITLIVGWYAYEVNLEKSESIVITYP